MHTNDQKEAFTYWILITTDFNAIHPYGFEYDTTDYNNNDCEDYAYNYDNNNVDVDDDNSDDSYTSYSSEDGCSSYNTPNIIIEIHGYRFNIDKNQNVIS